MKHENNDLLQTIKTTKVKFSKGNDFKITEILNEETCNWNFYRAENLPLVHAFHDYLENRIINMGLTTNIQLAKGDAIFFRDNLVLHGRNAFIGDRWLKKGGISWIPN